MPVSYTHLDVYKRQVLVIGDGMADTRLPQLAGKTPLEALALPAFDRCAGCFCGRALTVPHLSLIHI